jgi:hypothetical protein
VKPHLQNNNGLEQKWPGGAVQAVEHLFFKCKALSSNPFHKKKKKKKKGGGGSIRRTPDYKGGWEMQSSCVP